MTPDRRHLTVAAITFAAALLAALLLRLTLP